MRTRELATVVAAILASVAISGSAVSAQDTEEGEGMAPTNGSVVNVTLQEWAVIPDVMSVPAGSVTFNASNVGPADPHELVIVRTDIPAGELPTREDGGFDEEAEGVEVIAEIEEFDPGLTESLSVDLPAGHYALLCNLVEEEEGELESHYQMGMWIDFEVSA